MRNVNLFNRKIICSKKKKEKKENRIADDFIMLFIQAYLVGWLRLKLTGLVVSDVLFFSFFYNQTASWRSTS